jgi:integrase/recombinase XerD
LRHALGHDLAEARWLLPGFVADLDAHGSTTVTVQAALAWVQRSTTGTASAGAANTVGPRRMTAVRGFARYLSGIDPDTEVPPFGLLPHRQRWRAPFLYSPADIDAVRHQARSIVSPLRAATYDTLIGLLAASGLRIGEAIKLDCGDVDWAEGVLTIRESKFGKSRLVPLHPSTMAVLADFARQRHQRQQPPAGPSFFVSLSGTRLCYAVVSQTFRQLVDRAGVGAGATSAPRLHDLRHTFAVTTLLGWYRDGGDVQSRIPSLSTYLGHREPASTYWYLSAAPELLALAAARHHTAWSAARPGSGS